MDLSSPVRVDLVLVGFVVCEFRDVEIINENDLLVRAIWFSGPKYLLRSRGHA